MWRKRFEQHHEAQQGRACVGDSSHQRRTGAAGDKDTGVGFDSSRAAQGIGLASMAERLRMAGGTLSVISAPGKGTEIKADVPLVACSSESAA